MSVFAYRAARTDGAVIRGTLEAASENEAAAVLSTRGLLPLAVATQPPKRPGLFARAAPQALAPLFQGLSSLVETGVPLHKALQAVRPLAPPRLVAPLQRVEARVREGSGLAAALAAEDGLFPPVTIGLLRAGERGVGLAPALAHAARQLERDAESRSRVRAALTYPLVLLVVGSGSLALIVLFVIPRFAALLGDLGQALPPATRILLASADTIRQYGLALVALGVAALVLGTRWIAERRGAWHSALLELPIVGAIRHALASARAARTLGTLLATGAPALAALDTAREAAGDAAVADRISAARSRVAQGASLSDALSTSRAFTPQALQLAAIGEASGKLPTLLQRAADLDDETAERRMRALAALLEPALIVGFAGLVAFVAAALLQAVYALRPGL
ncbi:MAG: type II secretion system F family protein [Myxococcota bacterium]